VEKYRVRVLINTVYWEALKRVKRESGLNKKTERGVEGAGTHVATYCRKISRCTEGLCFKIKSSLWPPCSGNREERREKGGSYSGRLGEDTRADNQVERIFLKRLRSYGVGR
jgi:hypothetical protein